MDSVVIVVTRLQVGKIGFDLWQLVWICAWTPPYNFMACLRTTLLLYWTRMGSSTLCQVCTFC